MDARAGARLGAVRPGDGDQAEGVARRRRRDIADWNFEVWSNTHSMRPGRRRIDAGGAAHGAAIRRCRRPGRCRCRKAAATATRSRSTNFPTRRWCITSSRRCRCGFRRCARSAPITTCFRIESFMDELAGAAGADPVEFRLKHLDDPRGRDVIDKAAQAFGWRKGQKAPPDRGFGFAFARYKNLAAYCAHCQRGRGEPGDRASASGARGRRRRQRPGGQSGRADQPDRGRDPAVDELDAV